MKSLLLKNIFILCVCGYFLLNLMIRLQVTSTVDFDHAEQFYFSQVLDLGYNGQPPLYTYISKLLFSIFGVNFWVLLAFKSCIFLCMILVMMKIAQTLKLSYLQKLVAVFGLALIPHLIFHSQRMLTHTVLVTLWSLVLLWQVFQLIYKHQQQQSTIRPYIAIGVICALGLLTKYNFLLFIVAILVALLIDKEHRKLVLTPKIIVAISITTLLFLPHFLWAIDNFTVATEGLNKLEAKNGSVFLGIGLLAQKLLGFSALLLVCAIPILRRRYQLAKCASFKVHPIESLLVNITLMVLLELLLLVILTDAQEIKERWLMPLLIQLPIMVALSLVVSDKSEHPHKLMVYKKWRHKLPAEKLITTGVFFALLAMVLLPLTIVLDGKLGKKKWANTPYQALLQQIETKHAHINYFVTDKMTLAGNIRHHFKHVPVLLPKNLLQLHIDGNGLLVCESADCLQEETLNAWLKSANQQIDKLTAYTVSSAYYYQNSNQKLNAKTNAKKIEALHHVKTLYVFTLKAIN